MSKRMDIKWKQGQRARLIPFLEEVLYAKYIKFREPTGKLKDETGNSVLQVNRTFAFSILLEDSMKLVESPKYKELIDANKANFKEWEEIIQLIVMTALAQIKIKHIFIQFLPKAENNEFDNWRVMVQLNNRAFIPEKL